MANMKEVIRGSQGEIIRYEENGVLAVEAKNATLPIVLPLKIRKIPRQFQIGDCPHFRYEIDKSSHLQSLVDQAKSLINCSPREAAEHLLEIRQKAISWTEVEFQLRLPLSQILKEGRGDCEAISVLMAILIQEMGYKGFIAGYDEYQGKGLLKNIIRPDTKRKIFSSLNVGSTSINHAWNQIIHPDTRELIDFDFTVGINGFDPEQKKIFTLAGYHDYPFIGELLGTKLPEGTGGWSLEGNFSPGLTTGNFFLTLISREPKEPISFVWRYGDREKIRERRYPIMVKNYEIYLTNL